MRILITKFSVYLEFTRVFILWNISRSTAQSNTLCTSQSDCSSTPAQICAGIGKRSPWFKYTLGSNICQCPNGTLTALAGPYCDTVCPGGPNSPCSDHGECVFSTAACVCDDGWAGTNCSITCPIARGQICAGNGACVVPTDGSAPACLCEDGWRGPACSVECQGGSDTPCSNTGVCEPDGSCTCLGGWRGPDCSIPCPGSYLLPCNMNGLCTLDAECECFPGFAGPSCQYRCPVALGVPCAGRGLCNSSGACECNFGFRGPACATECAGGAGRPCGGHGECLDDGSCNCRSKADPDAPRRPGARPRASPPRFFGPCAGGARARCLSARGECVVMSEPSPPEDRQDRALALASAARN